MATVKVGAKYKPTVAFVIYEVDKEKDIVKISEIKDFVPKNQYDFDPEKSVHILYRPKKGKGKPEYFKGRILKLGLNRDSLEDELKGKRVSIPKIFSDDVEELNDNLEEQNNNLNTDEKVKLRNAERKGKKN